MPSEERQIHTKAALHPSYVQGMDCDPPQPQVDHLPPCQQAYYTDGPPNPPHILKRCFPAQAHTHRQLDHPDIRGGHAVNVLADEQAAA